MKTQKLILIGLLIFTKALTAQTDFRSGYVIKLSGDTLHGKIDYQSDLLMSKNCKFEYGGNRITNYLPDSIIAFKFIDGRYYVSREINEKREFLECLIDGRISVFYMRDEEGDHYFLDKEGLELTELPYKEGVKLVNNKQVYYQTTKHIGALTYFMQDAPKLKTRIASFAAPTHKNLIQLAEDYHNEVCEEQKCIIYKKKLPLLKIIPELTGGVINYFHVENLNNKLYFQTGIITHIWIPRVNEKMYVRTGILFSQLEFADGKTNFYKIPVQFEYFYPKGIFRPRLSYGLNFYYPTNTSVSLNLGTNIKLTKSAFISATYEIEFNPTMMILPGSLLANSFNIGILLNL
jgi:hypothetical protein